MLPSVQLLGRRRSYMPRLIPKMEGRRHSVLSLLCAFGATTRSSTSSKIPLNLLIHHHHTDYPSPASSPPSYPKCHLYPPLQRPATLFTTQQTMIWMTTTSTCHLLRGGRIAEETHRSCNSNSSKALPQHKWAHHQVPGPRLVVRLAPPVVSGIEPHRRRGLGRLSLQDRIVVLPGHMGARRAW